MNKPKDNDATILAQEQTYCINYAAEDIFDRGANYLDELANKNFFLDAISNYIKNTSTDFQGDVENPEDILAFIKNAYEKSGVNGDKKKGAFSYNPSSLKEWISGKRIPTKAETQRIALCLGMKVTEATEFVLKGSLVKPFNFKEIQDSVYYFCLNMGMSFTEAQQIIKEVENSDMVPEKYPENDTIKIGEKVQTIQSKDELIKYLATNKDGFSNQNQTALNMLKELIKTSVDLAEWERKEIKEFSGDASAPAIESEEDVPAILSVILG